MRDHFHPARSRMVSTRSFFGCHGAASAGLAGYSSRRGRADLGSHGLRKDACGLHALLRRPCTPLDRGDAARSDARGVRLAAQGPDQRRPRKLGEAACRLDRPRPSAGPADGTDSLGRAHRRHDDHAAPADAAKTAARARDDARVALYLADGREVARAVSPALPPLSSTRFMRWRGGQAAVRIWRSRSRVWIIWSSRRTGKNRSASVFRRPCVHWKASRSS